MVWHKIPANILFIVNVIFTDGIRVFLNTLTQKIEANYKITIFFCSGIINLLFVGLAYNTSGHFAHCSYFSSPLLGFGKILRNSQNIRTYYMLNHRIRCMETMCNVRAWPQQCWKSCANGYNIAALHFTEQNKCWELLAQMFDRFFA